MVMITRLPAFAMLLHLPVTVLHTVARAALHYAHISYHEAQPLSMSQRQPLWVLSDNVTLVLLSENVTIKSWKRRYFT